ncbi:hypothetical protein Tdes44962_MAKER08647 [Teratosphaeria destructans]|uniref:Uncharacterized protein n=1 Tax=Teratosphaeria destructans TaxID=418781 RepID=A0A9W7SW68_9PEZI|nr:hypothetical protein Tdes44962_MAKER08647 [Teratosphaeria destructans]
MYASRWAPKQKSPAEEEKFNEPRPTASLSAAAPSFAPADLSPALPPADVSSNDNYFGQTGAAPDELFDDVVPVDESMRVRSDDDLFSEDFTPVAQPIVEEQPPPIAQPSPRGRGDVQGSRPRGRGRGRGGIQQQDFESGPSTLPAAREEAAQPMAAEGAVPQNAPTGPKKDTVMPVRGDRHATGGVKKPKLTEEELAEKMAQIQIKNAELNAAHARAQADADSFAKRETQAKIQAEKRQREERRDRQQMMGEREKNRQRKLKAVGGREWDMEKSNDDFERGGRFDGKGFGRDRADYSDGREYLYHERRGGGERERGGGRGGRGGRGGGRERVPRQEDFPALPAKPDSSLENADAGGKSWADQVESAT